MAGPVPFLMKDLVLLAVSFYLLKQDFIRITTSSRDTERVPSQARAAGQISAAI
jgi:hypothetical protein